MCLQALGLGKLKPNTLLIGYKSDWIKADPRDVFDYYNVIQYVHTQNSVLSCLLWQANKILILISHAQTPPKSVVWLNSIFYVFHIDFWR